MDKKDAKEHIEEMRKSKDKKIYTHDFVVFDYLVEVFKGDNGI